MRPPLPRLAALAAALALLCPLTRADARKPLTKWLPDGRRIAFVAEVVAGAETPEATKKVVDAREKGKVKARVTESRLYRFVSHAGVYRLLGQSASDSTDGRHLSYGGYPFTDLARVERWSPDRFAEGFRTPMLILHGERDFRAPAAQGLEIYGVRTAKGVPARLVYYPDENHWVLKGQNSKHWYGEVLGWLARWLH